MEENKEKELQDYVINAYKQNFNYGKEHWDWGNYDDSFEYGFESGFNKCLEHIAFLIGINHEEIAKELKKEKSVNSE